MSTAALSSARANSKLSEGSQKETDICDYEKIFANLKVDKDT